MTPTGDARRARSSVLLTAMVATLGCNALGLFRDQSVVLDVSDLKAPAAVTATSPIDVVLTVVTGGCLSFDRIAVERSGSAAQVTVWGKDSSKGRRDVACPADIRFEPHNYRFEPPFTGNFEITVNRGRLSPLMATVQVQ